MKPKVLSEYEKQEIAEYYRVNNITDTKKQADVVTFYEQNSRLPNSLAEIDGFQINDLINWDWWKGQVSNMDSFGSLGEFFKGIDQPIVWAQVKGQQLNTYLENKFNAWRISAEGYLDTKLQEKKQLIEQKWTEWLTGRQVIFKEQFENTKQVAKEWGKENWKPLSIGVAVSVLPFVIYRYAGRYVHL